MSIITPIQASYCKNHTQGEYGFLSIDEECCNVLPYVCITLGLRNLEEDICFSTWMLSHLGITFQFSSPPQVFFQYPVRVTNSELNLMPLVSFLVAAKPRREFWLSYKGTIVLAHFLPLPTIFIPEAFPVPASVCLGALFYYLPNSAGKILRQQLPGNKDLTGAERAARSNKKKKIEKRKREAWREGRRRR